jgi:colanic acid/amylovoran biosynthesis glycosyltransferase
VVHYLAYFPTLSQTFVMPLLRQARAVQPVVFAQVVGEGAPDGISVHATEPSPPRSKLWARIEARLRGFELREELSLWKSLRVCDGVDLVHAHFGPQGYAAARACSRLSLPLVCTFYGYDLKLGSDAAWRRRYRKLWAAADALAVEGPFMAETLAAMGAPRARIVLQPLPVPVESISFAPRTRKGGEPLRLIQIARMVEKKGIDLTLRAVAEARKLGIDAQLDLVGDGPLERKLRGLVGELGIGAAVRFRGALDHQASLKALADAHLLIQPSRTASDGDTEGGAPYTILEGQASGLLIVASRHADIPNIVAAEAFFACDENDLGGLVKALVNASDAGADWGRRARAGRAFVERGHSATAVVARMEAVYARIVEERRAERTLQSRSLSASL